MFLGDDDENELDRDIDDLDEDAEEDVGIDLFAENFLNETTPRMKTILTMHATSTMLNTKAWTSPSRRALDARLNRRDREIARPRNLPAAYLADDDEDGFVDLAKQPRRRRHQYDEDQVDIDMDANIMDEELTLEALQDVKANSLTDWVSLPVVQRTISREFKSFLTEYTDDNGTSVYGNRIRTLGEINAESLEVSYTHLSSAKAVLAYFVANTPTEILKIFDQVAMDTTLLHYPDYEKIHTEIHVRITDIPVQYTLRQLRQSHLNCLVRVSGVVTRRSGVFPQLKYVKFDCGKCGVTLGPFAQDSHVEVKISYCQNCQSRGPFNLNSEKTIYRNYQKITLQESPGTVPAGRLPKEKHRTRSFCSGTLLTAASRARKLKLLASTATTTTLS